MGDGICLGITFSHAFTGCDSTSSLFSFPKGKWFDAWMRCPIRDDVTTSFQQLSWLPTSSTIESGYNVLSRFVVYVYNHPEVELNAIRLSLFKASTKGNPLWGLLPSADVFLLHIKRSCYQAGWVWGNTLSKC